MFGNCHNSHTLLKCRARSLLIIQVLLHSTGVLNLAEFKALKWIPCWCGTSMASPGFLGHSRCCFISLKPSLQLTQKDSDGVICAEGRVQKCQLGEWPWTFFTVMKSKPSLNAKLGENWSYQHNYHGGQGNIPLWSWPPLGAAGQVNTMHTRNLRLSF